jgi:hypothetical protein
MTESHEEGDVASTVPIGLDSGVVDNNVDRAKDFGRPGDCILDRAGSVLRLRRD